MSDRKAPGWELIYNEMFKAYRAVTNEFEPKDKDEFRDLFSSCITAALAVSATIIFENSVNRENALAMAEKTAKSFIELTLMRYDHFESWDNSSRGKDEQ